MSFNNEIHNVLRFHEGTTDTQLFRQQRVSATDLEMISIISNNHFLPPFQIMRPSSLDIIISVELIDKDDNVYKDIIGDFPADAPVEVLPLTNGYDYIQYVPKVLFILPVLPCGYYYLKITDAGGYFWVSELMIIKNFLAPGFTPYIQLDWKSDCDIANNWYQDEYFNRLYIDAELAKPENVVEREEIQNEETGETEYTNKIYAKLYKFTFFAPEHVFDAIELVWMHSLITLYDRKSSHIEGSTIREFEVTSSWNDDDGLVKLECAFKVDIVVSNDCCVNGAKDCCFAEVANVDSVASVPPGECGVNDRYLDTSSVPYVLRVCSTGVSVDNEECNYVLDVDTGNYWYYYGGDWYLMGQNDPELTSISGVGPSTFTGITFPNTMVQMQVFVGSVWVNVGSPVVWSVFNLIGYDVNFVSGSYTARYIAYYLDNCEYTSNSLVFVIP